MNLACIMILTTLPLDMVIPTQYAVRQKAWIYSKEANPHIFNYISCVYASDLIRMKTIHHFGFILMCKYSRA